MTALAQGMAGLTLVICFALLRTCQVGAASTLLAVQSVSVALAALAQHQPLIAAATVVIGVFGASWLLRPRAWGVEQPVVAAPVGGAKLGIAAGAALAVLCQSCGALGLPLAVALLSILLAATRHHPVMRLIALVSLQNGVALAACLVTSAPLPALACFLLPVPLTIATTLSEAPWGKPSLKDRIAGSALLLRNRHQNVAAWLEKQFGWIHLAASLGLCIASLTTPIDPLGSIFAPLIGAEGAAQAWAARRRPAQTLVRRGAALTKLGFLLLAVGTSNPVVAWLGIVGAITAAMLPALPRRWNNALLAFCAAGLALFGLLTMPADLPTVSYPCLFVGYAAVAAVVPELGVVILVRFLRLAIATPLPPVASTVAICIAVAALSYCIILLPNRTGRHRLTLLLLAQISIGGLTIGLGPPDARFAAMILLILLILNRAAIRLADGSAAAAAMAGLAGIPPLGVFPGLVLVVLAVAGHAPWLLLPIGMALVMMIAAGMPMKLASSVRTSPLSVGWVPLTLCFLFGFFAPDHLVQWLRALTGEAS